MRLKDGTINPDIRTGLLIGLYIADRVYQDNAYDEMVITSLKDGRHSQTSLHYSGAAADLRIRDLREGDAEKITDEIRRRLNRHYDVILESDHIHLEWQPRS